MAVKIANRDARQYVWRRQPFTGNNLYAEEWMANLHRTSVPAEGDSGYAVFSYGFHWPLFVAVTLGGRTVWFENTDKHSVSTSKHRSQTHPHTDTTPLTVQQMRTLVQRGYTYMVRQRVFDTTQTEFHQEVA
jgi:hypothetical protein